MKNKKMYYAVPIFILAMVMVGFISTQPVNSLTMDVNPSIELVTSRLDRVVEINPLNKDAKELLEGFKPKDKNLENTVNDLVDLMILTGHIKGGKDNFVMLTVEDDSMDSKIVDKVNKAIAAMLENKQIEAIVLNQGIEKGQKSEKQTGVQLAAQRLHELDDDLTIEEIENMTVRELVHYSKAKNIPIENLFSVAAGKVNVYKQDDDNDSDDGKKDRKSKGSVEQPKKSTNSRITPDQAKKIALDKVGGGKVIEFELDDDEYEIEIIANGKEYEIEINAYTGEILEFDVDDLDD